MIPMIPSEGEQWGRYNSPKSNTVDTLPFQVIFIDIVDIYIDDLSQCPMSSLRNARLSFRFPAGKREQNYGKSQSLMGKITIDDLVR